MGASAESPAGQGPPSAVVLVIDRWGAGFLGPYGNTWLDTPQVNRLASQALLAETVLADSSDLAGAYRSYWSGRHALEPLLPEAAWLPELAHRQGLHTVLLTDEPAVAELPGSAGFAEQIVLPVQSPAAAAEELDQTGMGQFFLRAIELLQSVRQPALVWLHSRGMGGPWDAPSPLRQQFADEDDPLPPDFIDPPDRLLPADYDPDDLLGLMHAYGGQVSLLDTCVGLLADALDASSLGGGALFALTSPRGYPLGEHRQVGPATGGLYGELLHVPLLLRFPDRLAALERTHQLLQPADLAATLADWLGVAPAAGGFATSLLRLARGEALARRDVAYAAAPGERAIRTPAWFLRESGGGEARRELYVKPDDRWEVNEVASRGGEVVEQLIAAMVQFEQAAAAGTLAALPPLAQVLTDTRR